MNLREQDVSTQRSLSISIDIQDYFQHILYNSHTCYLLLFHATNISSPLVPDCPAVYCSFFFVLSPGWWFVAKGKEEGWVPCGYLEPINQEQEQDDISESAASNLG